MSLSLLISSYAELLRRRVTLLCGIAAIALVGCSSNSKSGESTATGKSPSHPSSSASSTAWYTPVRAEPPAPRDQGYVGSEACRECHAQIAEQYAQHPMGMSIAPVANLKLIEQQPPDWLEIAGPDQYRVELELDAEGEPTRLSHQQRHFDRDGNQLGDVREPIAFAIGSGQKGRAYVTLKDGMLFQSPIGWYTGKDCWDLSPGYSPERHPGFQRRIDSSCLYCHAGRIDAQNDEHYSTQIFHEAAIGCERCHGPGEKHIQFHRLLKNEAPKILATANRDSASPSAEGLSDPICNPADLAPQAREDVCNQCHLQAEQVIPRFGRSFFDFRPGDRLEDVFVIFSSNRRQESRGNFQAVSHVEQMRESRCYQASPQSMGCISCHDPHQTPSKQNRVQHYRQSCLKCHTDQNCSVPMPERLKRSGEDSCVDCHMPSSDISNVPHTIQTDHRILRSPQSAPSSAPTKAWAVVDGAQERLPAWEIARARGLVMINVALKNQDPAMAIKAREYLLPSEVEPTDWRNIIAALANDPESLSAIASSLWLEGAYAEARPFWEQTLKTLPQHETALSGLIQIELQANELTSAERYALKLIDCAPAEATHWVQLSSIQWKLKKYTAAIQAAETALKLAPELDETRTWLSQARKQQEAGLETAR